MAAPKLSSIRQDDTHRLIPASRSDEAALSSIADNPQQLDDLMELEGATNDRLLGEANLLPGISVHELLFGVAYSHIVNAAFTHAHPGGSRFNANDRGAWYAAFEAKTAQTEIAYHKGLELQEIQWTEVEVFTFDDYLADFRSDFHDIRDDSAYASCLDAGSYVDSQELARTLLAAGSAGIVYPSVRRPGGICLVCFRPALVTNVRKSGTITIRFRDAYSDPEIVSDARQTKRRR